MDNAQKQRRYRQWVKLMVWAAKDGWKLRPDVFVFERDGELKILTRDGKQL